MGFFADLFKKFPSTIVSRDPNSQIGKLFQIITEQFDDLRISGEQLETIRDIELSVGDNLDQIGVIVKEARKGKNDPDYRIALFIATIRDRSNGSAPTIRQLARLISNDQFFRLIPGFLLKPDLLDGNEFFDGLGVLDPGDINEPAHFKLEFEGQISTLHIPSDLVESIDLVAGAGISNQIEGNFLTDAAALADHESEVIIT